RCRLAPGNHGAAQGICRTSRAGPERCRRLRKGANMLSKEENELVSRVGPGTLMGNLFRQYWVPALLSSELPTPDSDPLRVLLLGEKLIAFRDTNGAVGLIQNHCPH